MNALIVVDFQTAFVTGDHAVPAAQPLLHEVTGLVDAARTAGALVVHLQNDGRAGAADEPGTPGWQLHLRPAACEMVIRKSKDDGFEGTNLGEVLAAHGILELVICGVMSEMCVSATARTALARGYRVVIPHDAHATQDIPPGPGTPGTISAAVVSRVAEWALGDEVILVAQAAQVQFSG